MIDTKIEFNKRLAEIDLYFQTLEILDKGRCKILCQTINGDELKQDINEELTRILKANGFLLLYNLIESTIRKSITAIFNAMHSESVTFHQLTLDLRKLWINQQVRDFKEGTFKIDTLKKLLYDIADSILNSQLLQFESTCVNISGNIDAREIRGIAAQFGFKQSLNGEELLTVKDKRNKLAHGELTFTEIGRDYTINDLITFKEKSHNYLLDVLNCIEEYINERKYKVV